MSYFLFTPLKITILVLAEFIESGWQKSRLTALSGKYVLNSRWENQGWRRSREPADSIVNVVENR